MKAEHPGLSRWIRTAELSAVLLVIVAAFNVVPLVREFGVRVSDTFFRIAPLPKERSRVVVVSIDDESLRTYGRWPWSRTVLAQLTRNLKQAGAQVIGLDILLSESQSPEADRALSEALRGPSTVVVDKIATYPDGPRWIEPLDAFSRSAAVGHAQAVLDTDGVCRRFPPRELSADGARWAFAIEVARRADSKATEEFLQAHKANASEDGPVLTRAKPILIPIAYRRDGFETISASRVLEGGDLANLRGRPVLVGFGPADISDRVSTPVSGELPTPGVEVHAQILDSIMSRRVIRAAPPWFSVILLAFTCVVVTAVLRCWHGWSAIAWIAAIGALVYAGALGAFVYGFWTVSVGTLLLAVVVGPVLAYVADFVVIERNLTAQLRELQRWLSSRGRPVPRHNDLSWRLELLGQLQGELGSLYELHKTLLETTQDPVAIFDERGRPLLDNRRFEELYPHALTLGELRALLWPRCDATANEANRDQEDEVLVAGELHTVRVAALPRTTLTPLGGTVVTLTSLKVRAERDRARAEALAFVTHELRSPLVAIQGFAELMMEYPESAACKKAPDTIFRESKRLLALINSYLDVLRLDAGARPIRQEPVALNDVIRQVFDVLQPLAAAVSMGLVMSGDTSSIVGDRSLLAGAVLNLVSNAIKYGKQGTSVEVRCSTTGNTVAISVHNQGEPIAREDVARIFDPYYRAPEVETGNPGWGLGLAFVKRIAEKHGGSVQVESGDAGTTFEIHLPAEQGVVAARGAA